MLRKPGDLEHDVAADAGRLQLQRRHGRGRLGPAAPAIERGADESPDAVRHVADDQDDEQAVDRKIKPGNAFQEPQPFRDQDQQAGADRRADRRGHAAEQRHREEHDRFRERELVGADIGEPAGEQSAGEAAERRADPERVDLGAEHVDAADAGGEFIVAHRAHGPPEPGGRQVPDAIADQRQHRDAEREITLRALEQSGTADIGDAVRAVGQPDRVDHHQRDDLLERDRHHREVMAAEPQRRHAEEGARPQRHEAAGDQTEPVAQMQVGGADADGIGARNRRTPPAPD